MSLFENESWMQQNFGLDKRLIKALSKLNYTYPTMVQSKSIPFALQGKDLLVRARTGSGKTLAFCLPMLHKVLLNKDLHTSSGIYGLILVPTKELCKQIEKNINNLIYYCRDSIHIYSLIEENTSILQYQLQQPLDIIISTPAKLVTLIKQKLINLSNIQMLVMDEADLMLSFGYAEDVQVITSKLPKIVQGLLMSATLSPELEKFKRIVLNNPIILKLEEPKNIGKLLQFYVMTPIDDKYLILYVFLKLGLLQGKGLIFVNDLNKCYKLKLILQQFFINAAVLNAEMPLNSRLHILDEFNRGVFDLLIATDESMDHGDEEEEDYEEEGDGKQEIKMTSKEKEDKNDYGVHRGLDFQGVSFVVNFDFPTSAAAYTHRIGRTARGTASGTALSFVTCYAPGSKKRVYDDTSKDDEEDLPNRDLRILQEVQSQQPRLGTIEGDNILTNISSLEDNNTETQSQLQPSQLNFNMQEIESFRYRVQDTVRSVTTAVVKELRSSELKKEILNSQKLKKFFAENPNDFQILRHDKAIVHPIQIKEHLRIVPSYLIPTSMKKAINVDINAKQVSKKKKRKLIDGETKEHRIQQSKLKDPLFNIEVVNEKTQEVEDDEEDINEDMNEDVEKSRIFTNKESKNLGRSLSGRKQWKMRHHKGEYNQKNQKKYANTIKGSFNKKK